MRSLLRITADFAPLYYGAIRQVVELPRLLRVVASHTAGLRVLRYELGDRFVQGVVLAALDRTIPLGDRITAAPISALWS